MRLTMIKTISFLKRKPGISREEFRKHYEEVHAPLAVKYLTGLKRDVRNHVLPTPGQPEPDFDCITEFWYEDMEAVQRVQEFLQTDEAKIINDDQDLFIDGSQIRYVSVEECESP
jgi:uncharacterized protein (TIGR02118 family)